MTTNGWFEVDCPCRDDGPWSVWANPANQLPVRYPCARCGADMTIKAFP